MLVTNDDGVKAEGLRALVQTLAEAPGTELLVIAPDRNRSGAARSVSAGAGLRVWPVDLGLDARCFATDGTPVDAVRLARVGLLAGFEPDMVVSGVNHGPNLGDDITYSGTVAAALEAILVGLPGIAVSQQSDGLETGFAHTGEFSFDAVAAFVAELLAHDAPIPVPPGGMLSINAPAGEPSGVEITRLVRRTYHEILRRTHGAEHRYEIETSLPDASAAAGTDAAAIAAGLISVTPLRFDLMDADAMSELQAAGLQEALARAGRSATR